MDRLTYRDKYGKAHAKSQAGIVSKLCKLEDAQEQGRLVELPCKVGDAVYVHKLPDCSECQDANACIIRHGEKCSHWTITKHPFRLRDLEWMGNTTFLTREEAEAALEAEEEK